MMMELREHYLVWKFLLLLLRPYRRWAPGSWWTCEHTGILVKRAQESRSRFSISTTAGPPSPAHLWGPDGLCSLRDVALFAPHAKSPQAQQPCCLLELNDSSAPLYLSRISMCSFFSSPLCPFFSSSVQSEFHYSLSSQCLSTSTFIHINSEWQSLTICWECWQQIVS